MTDSMKALAERLPWQSADAIPENKLIEYPSFYNEGPHVCIVYDCDEGPAIGLVLARLDVENSQWRNEKWLPLSRLASQREDVEQTRIAGRPTIDKSQINEGDTLIADGKDFCVCAGEHKVKRGSAGLYVTCTAGPAFTHWVKETHVTDGPLIGFSKPTHHQPHALSVETK